MQNQLCFLNLKHSHHAQFTVEHAGVVIDAEFY